MSKKKITDPKGSMEELIARVVEAAKAPFTPDRKAELLYPRFHCVTKLRSEPDIFTIS